jgi:ABC-type branched-subunit amino acid transport system ATPase component
VTDIPTPGFSNDQPLTGRQHDRLNRAPFAQRIANVLLGLPKGAGLVVGIHGPWGDGKTTVLNLVRADLEISTDTVIVDFNPWRFTDESSMLAGFFRVLAGTISAKLSTNREEIAGWIETIARYASVVTDRFGKTADIASAMADVGLEDLRDRLNGALAQADKRIVVIVDDIDRLDKHETHTLFRLIKACADFPNVSYLLAFDDTAVAKALADRYGAGDEQSGRAFLEKIIQVPLKLPVAAKEDLRTLCFDQVDAALTAAGIELTREQVGEFVAGFDRGVSVRLTTPRAAKRYGNGLLFALPMLKGETNPADLLLVEALRAFFPEVYDVVRENHTAFSGVEPELFRQVKISARSAELLKPLLDSIPSDHAKAVKELLIDLFPRLSGVFGNSTYADDWLSRWSKERRISSPEYCPRYFAYAVPGSDIPDAEIVALVDAATKGEEAAVEAGLATHLADRRAGRVIEKLRAIETTVDPNAAEMLAKTIAKLGKNIPNPPALFTYKEAPGQAAILISHLLRRIPDRVRRVVVAKRVIEAADPLWFGAECIQWLYLTDKPEKQDSNTLTNEETSDVRGVLVDRIKFRAATGAPLFDPDLPQERSLLFEWWQTEGRDPVQAHLVAVFTKDAKQVARFLQSLAPLAWSEGAALPRVGELGARQLKNMKLIIDLDTMAAWVRKHCPGNFDDPTWLRDDATPLEQRLAEQFMFIYNKWKKDGEPPDQ